MTTLIILFGVLTLVAGCLIAVNPLPIFGYLRSQLHRLSLQVSAVVVRLVLGALLVSQADLSRFPLVIEILGWLSIIAAILLTMIGRGNFQRLMLWALSFAGQVGRFAGVVAALFGAFIVYAFVV